MIIFHDVDGCLNAPNGQPIGFTEKSLSENLKNSLSDLGKMIDDSKVKHFVLNTGRSWRATEYLCHAIPSTKLRYALVEHGAELWDSVTGTKIDLNALAAKHELQSVLEALESAQYISELIAWYKKEGGELLSNRLDGITSFSASVDKTSNLTIRVPENVDGDRLMSALEQLIASHEILSNYLFVYHHSKSDGYIDVMGKMDKGIGVELALKFLDGHIGDTIAIGNGLNDLPMLSAVAHPVCPASSVNTVKHLCREKGHLSQHDFITTTTEWIRTKAM